MNRWNEWGFMPSIQLKGKPNRIANWPTLIPTCLSGCLCHFLTSQKLTQHSGKTFSEKTKQRVRKDKRKERGNRSCTHIWPKCQPYSCPSGQPYAKLVANRRVSARPLVIPSYDTCTSSGGVNMCLCTKTHTLSGVAIQWGRRFVERVCILLGIWLGSWYTYHPICFCLQAGIGVRGWGWGCGCSSVGRDQLPPGPGRDRKDRTGQDRTGQDMTWQGREGKEKRKFVQAGEGQTGQDRPNSASVLGTWCYDWPRGTDQPLQLLSVSHYDSNILAKQHEMK